MKNNLAFVFPGQGSQKIGMLSELAEFNPIIEETFSQASEVLGYDLWKMSQEGTQEQINLTERTQPLLLASSVSVWRVWIQRNGSMPGLLAGHSLGEWSALVCAGAVKFEDAIGIVRSRGALMQDAVPVGIGAMAAIIGLDDEAICQSCADARGDEVVDAVNFNAPGQVVIAGSADAEAGVWLSVVCAVVVVSALLALALALTSFPVLVPLTSWLEFQGTYSLVLQNHTLLSQDIQLFFHIFYHFYS